ncbi:Os04g0590800 [Oryza sativa Japonica Group]|uniref:Os04g0590800 protein n=3 Tax=Oryza sativa TaxID=4530 RepID=B9FC82_ORYSJ|nr:hypothetical protein OsJ_15971 [Oryza sativa Japonica Group]KAB8096704.1 hypothetical protein EE612_025268 [Oryza sativa]BAF15622.1 Os04g0590800 [Oryza sativa Japonica Group]BAS90749.1 Os04g0590800 [Oryza sativa Japonica Group]|eukprot:NP_001053708.1 Os04g0590800 [Oryza sativa Japonica Group]
MLLHICHGRLLLTRDSMAERPLLPLAPWVEEGCGMATVDDIAAAVHHVLCIIDAEAASQMLLAGEASG